MDEEGEPQRVAQSDADIEGELQHVPGRALGVQLAADPGLEQARRQREQREGEQAGDQQFQLVGALAQALEADAATRRHVGVAVLHGLVGVVHPDSPVPRGRV
ncbi:hypothetical protein ACFJI1_01160 [Pseudoxanthomonas sp. UC29_72]